MEYTVEWSIQWSSQKQKDTESRGHEAGEAISEQTGDQRLTRKDPWLLVVVRVVTVSTEMEGS